MNVEIGAEAALVPEKYYINGIAVAVPYAGIFDGDGISKLFRSTGIDAKKSIPPAYVAWRAWRACRYDHPIPPRFLAHL
jgi:hypothetical protein